MSNGSPLLSEMTDRSREVFRRVVESYLATGEPVRSRNLSRVLPMTLSPASVRNVMSDLEEMGLIVSPHTSAGRIPTARGYRLFVDTMLTVPKGELTGQRLAPDQPQRVISNAAHLLSSLSQFVGVVLAPRRSSVFRHIEFLRLSERCIDSFPTRSLVRPTGLFSSLIFSPSPRRRGQG